MPLLTIPPCVRSFASYDVPGCSIREGFLTGTHTGDYFGNPASGVSIRVAFAAFFVFDQASGDLLGERLYMDHGAAVPRIRFIPIVPPLGSRSLRL